MCFSHKSIYLHWLTMFCSFEIPQTLVQLVSILTCNFQRNCYKSLLPSALTEISYKRLRMVKEICSPIYYILLPLTFFSCNHPPFCFFVQDSQQISTIIFADLPSVLYFCIKKCLRHLNSPAPHS